MIWTLTSVMPWQCSISWAIRWAGSRLLCGSIISPLMWNNYHCLTTLSLVGKRRRRAHVGCGRMASNSGSKPKTSTKLQVAFNPRFVTNCNEEWRVLRNQLIILVKIIKCKNHSSTPSIILLLVGYSSVYFSKRLTLEMSALLSPHNGNFRLVLIPNVSVLLPLTSLSRQARNMDNKGHEVFPKLYSLKRQKQ